MKSLTQWVPSPVFLTSLIIKASLKRQSSTTSGQSHSAVCPVIKLPSLHSTDRLWWRQLHLPILGLLLQSFAATFSFLSISVLGAKCKYQDDGKQKQSGEHPQYTPSLNSQALGKSASPATSCSPNSQWPELGSGGALRGPSPHHGPPDRRGRDPASYSSIPRHPPNPDSPRYER